MIILVEFPDPCGITARPDLGLAMLIASCQQQGIETSLIKGQTRHLKDVFMNDTDEMWHLINDLDEEAKRKLNIENIYCKEILLNKDIGQFRRTLGNLYNEVIVNKDTRTYFNSLNIEKIVTLHRSFMALYNYYVIDLRHYRLKVVDRYIDMIAKMNPDCIGFSVKMRISPLARHIIKRTKETIKKPIVIGGSFTPFMDAEDIKREFNENFFDYLVIGAGERALPLLINAIRNKKEPRGIPNVIYRKKNAIEINRLEPINDLNSLPYPDYSQFELDLYMSPKRILPFQTSRGCPWMKCAFCSHSAIYFKTYRTMNTERVMEGIKHLRDKYYCKHFALHDEELQPERAKALSKVILDSKIKDLSFSTYARLVKGYNDTDLLRLMRRAGFSFIKWGLESGCQRVLNLMGKGTEIRVMGQILKKSSKNRIRNYCFIMFGFPGETKDEANKTISFLEENADYIDDVVPARFNITHPSLIEQNPQKWGVELLKNKKHSTKNGMDSVSLQSFYQHFIKKYRMNTIKITSGKLRYLPYNNIRNAQHFLVSSYNFLSSRDALRHLRNKKLDTIYPIVLGELEKKNNRTIFYPLDPSETVFINCISPIKEQVLSRFEKEIVILSNGMSSIKEIASFMRDDERTLNFFKDIFSRGQGMAFLKSWK